MSRLSQLHMGPNKTCVDIVLPVKDEEQDLEGSVETLLDFCRAHMSPRYCCRIVITDNGSTDGTLGIAKGLAEKNPGEVAWIHLPFSGKGAAIKAAVTDSEGDILVYMDVDLSTDLDALPSLVWAVAEERYDIANGSRLIKGSRVEGRALKREITSRGYNLLVKCLFFNRFSDPQCGFKAFNVSAAKEILPVTINRRWFLDSEILIIAEKNGYLVKNIPVRWVDDPNSKVSILSTARENLKGLLRLRFGGLAKASSAISLRKILA